MKSIYNMAKWSGFRTEKAGKMQIKGSESANKFVRYWALRMLSNDDDLSNLAIQQIMYQPNAASFLPEIKDFYEQRKKLSKKKLFNANRSAEMMLYVYGGQALQEEE